MLYTVHRLLEGLHKLVFRFDAQIQIYGWRWRYWYVVGEESPEGGYLDITDGIFCFQRRYVV
jgi:hypothetical protein